MCRQEQRFLLVDRESRVWRDMIAVDRVTLLELLAAEVAKLKALDWPKVPLVQQRNHAVPPGVACLKKALVFNLRRPS